MQPVTPKHAVMLLIQREADGKVLMIKRHPSRPAGGYWCPVSGRLEPGETESAAVVREALEEVALSVVAVRKLGSMLCSTGEYWLHWWEASLADPRAEARIAAPDELTHVAWVSLEELDQLRPHFREDIEFIKTHARTREKK